MIAVREIGCDDDLHALVDEINQASWDEANAISTYQADSLSAYLEVEGTVFVTCHEVVDGTSALLGMASARLEVKPYDGSRWLYVDEVDVCANHRQKGAGTAIMQRLLAIAKEAGCEELWLATEVDNVPANALYGSLDPDEVDQIVGYTYEFDD